MAAMENIDQSSKTITQLYFELSNAGNLSAIQALIIPEATYSSANTGLYYGITDIMAMMTAFFKSHQRLKWQVDSINALTDYITEVNFTCESTDKTGQSVTRTGVERVVVVDGLIRHIEVR